ncbi:hypothetical protein DPMN_097392 [Dreissena polymorpha]|uniref:Uncharacterized protein n=1 Tax=Dreissena polymorpha TaxID=45954 RepID=A0A9D4R5P9_DREPO|nr:hypothetical protein DPMN_097391 [Dreissena polymorpha]KAH3854838.1 hypothetical protein DPMN_097392 [Dreissena polymorpha]
MRTSVKSGDKNTTLNFIEWHSTDLTGFSVQINTSKTDEDRALTDVSYVNKTITPNVGLEPTTPRLRVSCSTD